MRFRRHVVVVVALLLICAYTYFVLREYTRFWGYSKAPIDLADPEKTHALWGQFGDFLGGMLNPLFGFLNLIAICYLAYEIHHLEGEREKDNKEAADDQRAADREAEDRQRVADREAEQRQRAVELLNQFMAGEFFLRARLICQQYLLPSGSRFQLSVAHRCDPLRGGVERLLDFNELAIHLGKLQVGQTYRGLKVTAEDKDASYYIRAIPSYFWLLDQALSAGHIRSETIFSVHYTWYWLHIIRFRRFLCSGDQLFRRVDWLLGTGDQQRTARNAIRQYLHQLDEATRWRWYELTLNSLSPDDTELPLMYYDLTVLE